MQKKNKKTHTQQQKQTTKKNPEKQGKTKLKQKTPKHPKKIIPNLYISTKCPSICTLFINLFKVLNEVRNRFSLQTQNNELRYSLQPLLLAGPGGNSQ